MRKLLLLLILISGVFAFACDFTFEPAFISGKLGDTAIVKVTVDKTHRNCSLRTMDEYHLEYDGVQLMGATPWKQVDNDTYEKWLKVGLSEIGNASIKIWKKCSKDGYEEKLLPITVFENENLITDLKENKLGFDTELSYETLRIEKLVIDKTSTLDEIAVGGKSVSLFEEITLKPGEYTVVYEDANSGIIAIFNDNFVYRFDHYIIAKS